LDAWTDLIAAGFHAVNNAATNLLEVSRLLHGAAAANAAAAPDDNHSKVYDNAWVSDVGPHCFATVLELDPQIRAHVRRLRNGTPGSPRGAPASSSNCCVAPTAVPLSWQGG
jgi:hypothetical protein